MEKYKLNVKKMLTRELKRFVESGQEITSETRGNIDGSRGLGIVEEENSQSRPSERGYNDTSELTKVQEKSLSSFNFK